jgi:hypothetical protein
VEIRVCEVRQESNFDAKCPHPLNLSGAKIDANFRAVNFKVLCKVHFESKGCVTLWPWN